MANNNEEKLRDLSVELRILEQRAEQLQGSLNMINAMITDLNLANVTLQNLEKEKPDSELLVPIGGNSYVRARLADVDKVIVSIGAGVSMEKPLPETQDILKKRQEELEKSRLSLQTQFTQTVNKINEDRSTVNALVAEMRGEKTSENV